MTNPRAHRPPPFNPQSSSLFSSLPDEIVLNILARIPRAYYRSVSLVSKSFYSFLSSPVIYTVRSSIGATEPRLYVCLWLVKQHKWYTLTVIDGLLRLAPVRPSSSHPEPPTRFSNIVVAGSEIYKIGGTVNGEQSRDVYVFDCRTHTWRDAPNMRVSRERVKAGFLDGKIYVIGGYRNTEEDSMNWGEVFNPKTQTWEPLPSPSNDVAVDSKYQVAVVGTKLFIITKHKKYAYDPKEKRWLTKDELVDMEPTASSSTGGTRCGGIEKFMEHIRGRPSCVIGNVTFTEESKMYKWFCRRRGEWIRVEGLNDLYEQRGSYYRTVEIVNYGGKLLTLWYEWLHSFTQLDEKKIWCAVIRLESSGTNILGEVERCNIILPLTVKYHYLAHCECVLL